MPRSCSICKKPFTRENGSSFSVPLNEARRNRWNSACSTIFTQSARVCEKHFRKADFINPPEDNCGPLRLQPGAVPLVFPDISESCPMPDIVEPNGEITPATSISCSTQTDFQNGLPENYMQHVRLLQLQIKELQTELADCKAQLVEAKSVLNSFFTYDQVRKLKNPQKVIRWSWQDISNAICLHAAGPRAYNHLYNKGFPQPHVSTLQRWARKVKMHEGILQFAIECMQNNTDLSEDQKVCVLSFDEMKVAAVYEHDPNSDSIREPANYVQMVMVRGLKASWKQPVFYSFDCKMTKNILTELITALRDATFTVVAIVSDMGPTNQGLWRELEVSIEKTWFVSPANENEKIFVFADAPHLLKLLRNHFLDSGLIWQNTIVNSTTLQQLVQHASGSDMSITYKLSDEHLSVRGAGRQKVKLAAQLFSNTTASAIRRCYSVGLELYNPIETANFIQLVNDWFDTLNSKMTTFNYPGKKPYGNDLVYQEDVLRRMDDFMKSHIIPEKTAKRCVNAERKSLAPFQKGILITNASLRLLREYVNEKFEFSYILTYRLNQDILEHFFGAIRSNGGLYDHPTPKNFTYRLRKYILARNTQLLNSTGNVARDDTQWLDSSTNAFNESYTVPRMVMSPEDEAEALNIQISDDVDIISNALDMVSEEFPHLTPHLEQQGEFMSSLNACQCMSSVPDKTVEEFPPELNEMNAGKDIDTLHGDAIEFVAGYVIKKLHLQNWIDDTASTWTYVDEISKGGLKKPNQFFLSRIKELEKIFNCINGDKIKNFNHFQTYMVNKSSAVGLPERVKKFFFKCRMHFRIKHLNKRLQIQKAKQKVMGNKKFVKIKL